MQQYLIAKIIAISIPLLLIAMGFFLPIEPHQHWVILILSTIFFGHVHNILSFRYQLRAINRRGSLKEQLWFWGLNVLSVITAVFFIMTGSLPLFGLIVFIFFYLHSYLNEKTILEQQTEIKLPSSYFVAISIFLTGFIYTSVTHESFFYGPSLDFANFSSEYRELFFSQGLGIDVWQVGALIMVGGLCFLFFSYRMFVGYSLLKNITAIIFIILGSMTFLYGPMNYLYLFNLFFSYHFILWSVYYYFALENKSPEKLRVYLWEHVILVVPLGILLSVYFLVDAGVLSSISQYVYDVRLFIVTVFAHTIVSFINEDWFKKYVIKT